jgi:hypothetical protein
MAGQDEQLSDVQLPSYSSRRQIRPSNLVCQLDDAFTRRERKSTTALRFRACSSARGARAAKTTRRENDVNRFH